MSQTTPSTPEFNPQSIFIESPFLEKNRDRWYPALKFEQGKRIMLQINIPAQDIPNLLQVVPARANDPTSGKDRPEIEGHANEIQDYIEERTKQGKPWILGTLTANIDPAKIQMVDLGRGFCLLFIPPDVKLDLTDGQHRRKAIEQLINSPNSSLLKNDYLPITVILESDFRQCQSDFRDLAQLRMIDKSLLVSYSDTSVRDRITKNIIESVEMFKDKTDKINKNPRTESKLIYTNHFVAKLVSCAFSDNPTDSLKTYPLHESSEEITQCLNEFFLNCSHTQYIAETPVEKLTVQDVIEFKEKCLLGLSVGLEILGRLLNCAYDQTSNAFNMHQVLQLSQLDWSRDSLLWQDNVVTVDPKPKRKSKAYKISYISSSISIAVNLAKENLGWN